MSRTLKPMFQPLRDLVLIQRDDDQPYGGASRIILLSNPEVKGSGTVVAVGPGAWVRRRSLASKMGQARRGEGHETDKRVPMTVKVGDRVVWHPVEGQEFFTFDGKCQVLLREHHLTIIEDEGSSAAA